jgi:hypothetical protein
MILHHQLISGSAPRIKYMIFIVIQNIPVKMKRDSRVGGKGNGTMDGDSWRQAAASAGGPRT